MHAQQGGAAPRQGTSGPQPGTAGTADQPIDLGDASDDEAGAQDLTCATIVFVKPSCTSLPLSPAHLICDLAGAPQQPALCAGDGQQAAAVTVRQSVSASMDQLQQLRLQAKAASQSLPMVCTCQAAKEADCCTA